MGAERLERGELADAEPLLQAAAHAAARELGQDDADWLIAAESLPTSQTRFRELCLALARLSGSLGRYEACLRLWRRVLPRKHLHERIAGRSPHWSAP
ncbi:MAG: hypothetical protein IPJ97_18485 [Proteobacteria bacterium]|nr:hypothetical protein [Pseudomonadota bacterium]